METGCSDLYGVTYYFIMYLFNVWYSDLYGIVICMYYLQGIVICMVLHTILMYILITYVNVCY